MVLHRDVCDTLDPIEVKNSENSKVIKMDFNLLKLLQPKWPARLMVPFVKAAHNYVSSKTL